MRKSILLWATFGVLIGGNLQPIASAQAESPSALVTCINFATKHERISRNGKCSATLSAQANWHLLNSDTPLPENGVNKFISICSNKADSSLSYRIIRPKCAKHQIRTDYFRSTVLPAAPAVAKVIVTGSSSAQISLSKDSNINPDAPVSYYTIVPSKGVSKNIYAWNGLTFLIDNLTELTTYSFSITATSADGTSQVSPSSESITTPKYVAPPVKSNAVTPVAQVSLLSDDTATVTIPAGATSVVIPSPTLGNPTLSFGSQGASVSATISAVANPAGGSATPFTVSGSTKIIDISISGLTGSATVCLDASPTAKLWHYVGGAWVDITTSHTSTQVCGVTSSFSPFTSEEQLPAPAFTLTSIAETKTVGSVISGYSITSTGGAVSEYSINPSISNNPGLSFSNVTGRITGTPTAARTARTYTISAINGSGTATQTFTITSAAVIYVIGDIGPAGGKIFYAAPTPFACGPTLESTCKYLEYAPTTGATGWTVVSDKWVAGTDVSSIPGAQGTAIGTGLKNSLAIKNFNSGTAAATRCLAYRGGGYDDWFLPSRFEADEIYRQASTVGYETGNTWTSSENSSSTGNAFFITDFSANGKYEGKVSYNMRVLPIRAF